MLSKKVLLLRSDGVVVARALRRTNFWNPTVAGFGITALFRSSYQSDKLLGKNTSRTATASFAMSSERGRFA